MGVLNTPQFHIPESGGGGQGILSELLRFGIEKYNASKAKQGLEALLNPVQTEDTVTVKTPEDVESSAAQKAIEASAQESAPSTEASPLADMFGKTQPSMAKDIAPSLTQPTAPNPQLASNVTDQMPMPKTEVTTRTTQPQPGDANYRQVPQGLSADAYNAVARSEMTPTVDKLAAAQIAAGKPVSPEILNYKQRPFMKVNDKGQYVFIRPTGDVAETGVKAKPNYSTATVRNPQTGQLEVQVFNNYENPLQPIGSRGAANDPLHNRLAGQWHTVYSDQAGRNVIVNGLGEPINGNGFLMYDPKEVAKNGPLVAQAADIYRTVNNVRGSASELFKTNPQFFQRPEVAKFVALLGDATNTGQFGPIHTYLDSELKRTMTPAETNYLTNLTNLYEGSMSSRNFLGVSARTSDAQRAMVVRTLPDSTDITPQQIEYKLTQFEDLIHTLSQGITNVPMPANGITIQQLNNDMLARRQGLPYEKSVLNAVNNPAVMTPQAVPQVRPTIVPQAAPQAAGGPKVLTVDIAKQYLAKYGNQQAAMAAAQKDGYSW